MELATSGFNFGMGGTGTAPGVGIPPWVDDVSDKDMSSNFITVPICAAAKLMSITNRCNCEKQNGI